jgi:endonuclease/exonuclease/phosphatase family metal-dependent hydrolase
VGQATGSAGSVPLPAPAGSTSIRAATFNVRTARATSDSRVWLQRVPDVAQQIVSRDVGIVLLQELGPGRADGKKAKIGTARRQTTSLTAALAWYGGGRNKLTRSTPLRRAGHGARHAGSTDPVRLGAVPVDQRLPRGDRQVELESACSFDLPVAAGDGKSRRRAVAVARFEDRSTGQQFWAVSAHLDERHSSSGSTEARYNWLRAVQAAHVADTVAAANPDGLPVFFGGDINSWQTGGYASHRALEARGYVDAVDAPTTINWEYPTVNHFKASVPRSKSRYGGVRLDVVLVNGVAGFTRYENAMVNPDSTRPSDHNMVVVDLQL